MKITPKELKDLYRERQQEGHWFDESTMAFFNSKVELVERRGRYCYFITSEAQPREMLGLLISGPGSPRLDRKYTARIMGPSGDIENIGPFCQLDYSDAHTLWESAISELVTDTNAEEWYNRKLEGPAHAKI